MRQYISNCFFDFHVLRSSFIYRNAWVLKRSHLLNIVPSMYTFIYSLLSPSSEAGMVPPPKQCSKSLFSSFTSDVVFRYFYLSVTHLLLPVLSLFSITWLHACLGFPNFLFFTVFASKFFSQVLTFPYVESKCHNKPKGQFLNLSSCSKGADLSLL